MKKHAKDALSIVLSWTALVVVLAFVFRLGLSVAPTHWWVEYHGIYPISKTYHVGDRPEFFSDRTYHRKVARAAWSDILECARTGEPYRRISEFNSQIIKPRPESPSRPWTYDIPIPPEVAGDQCRIRSSLCVELAFGAENCAEPFYSGTFEVAEY